MSCIYMSTQYNNCNRNYDQALGSVLIQTQQGNPWLRYSFSSNSSSTQPTSQPASQRSTFKPQITITVKETLQKAKNSQPQTYFHLIFQIQKYFRFQLSPISFNFNFKSFSNLRRPLTLVIICCFITKLRPKAQHNCTEISFYFT